MVRREKTQPRGIIKHQKARRHPQADRGGGERDRKNVQLTQEASELQDSTKCSRNTHKHES